MRYRWKKLTDAWEDDTWRLYLILDGKKYPFAIITWYEHIEQWEVFVAGFVCEDQVHVEKPYKLLCDAKADLMDYAKVWFVSGVYQGMNDHELRQWRESA